MDIKSFYPSLNPKRAAHIARIMWMKSNLDLEIDSDLLAKYVGKFCEQEKILEEKLTDYVYTKKKKKTNKKVIQKTHTETNVELRRGGLILNAKNVRKSSQLEQVLKEAMNSTVLSAVNVKKCRKQKLALIVKAKQKKKIMKVNTSVKKVKKTIDQLEEEYWSKPKKHANKDILKKLFGLALERLIVLSMENHIYQFDNVNRLQSSGGATGLDETGEVADLYMLWWDSEFLDVLSSVQIDLDLYA